MPKFKSCASTRARAGASVPSDRGGGKSCTLQTTHACAHMRPNAGLGTRTADQNNSSERIPRHPSVRAHGFAVLKGYRIGFKRR
eukprot:6214371-Pleurochrysis_carterae.AAC.7